MRRAFVCFKLRLDADVGLVVAQQTIEAPDDLPIPRNQDGSRETDKSAEFLGGYVVADQDGVVHSSALFTDLEPLVLNERSDNAFAFVVHSYTQYGKSAGTVFILQFHEPRYLDPARDTPGGPEIYQHHLTFELAQADVVVIQVLQHKVKRSRRLIYLIGSRRARGRNARGPIRQQSQSYNSYERRKDQSNSFHAGLLIPPHLTALERESIQKPQLSRKPRQLVHKNQPTDKQQERATKYLDCIQISTETLIKAQELADAESRQQEWDREPCRIDREQQYPTGHGSACSGESEERRQNRTDARRPPKCEREAEQETTPHAGRRTSP